MTDKLAVLIPVYNGGDLLVESVRSCRDAALECPYTIIVVDNCSTDGAVEKLLSVDLAGASMQVHRNPTNLGRIVNWNRALEIAENQGFQWATFLFVGDSWIPEGSLRRLLSIMKDAEAVFGMAPYLVATEAGKVL